jgi:hypothetical protein
VTRAVFQFALVETLPATVVDASPLSTLVAGALLVVAAGELPALKFQSDEDEDAVPDDDGAQTFDEEAPQ